MSISPSAEVTVAKVLVLDNDHTTGHYTHFFSAVWDLLTCSNKTKCTNLQLIAQLVTSAVKCHVFRPGLCEFLQRMATYKRLGTLSKVIMYTNSQITSQRWTTAKGTKIGYQQFLANCLGFLAGDVHFFDLILANDTATRKTTKDFKRIRGGLDLKPMDQVIFFDDHPEQIVGATPQDFTIAVDPYHSKCSIANLVTEVGKIYNLLVMRRPLTKIIQDLMVVVHLNPEEYSVIEVSHTLEEQRRLARIWYYYHLDHWLKTPSLAALSITNQAGMDGLMGLMLLRCV